MKADGSAGLVLALADADAPLPSGPAFAAADGVRLTVPVPLEPLAAGVARWKNDVICARAGTGVAVGFLADDIVDRADKVCTNRRRSAHPYNAVMLTLRAADWC